jgi:hypothetical protein
MFPLCSLPLWQYLLQALFVQAGVFSLCSSDNSPGSVFAYSPITHPGERDTTRMWGANALPNDRVIESIAAFEAQ